MRETHRVGWLDQATLKNVAHQRSLVNSAGARATTTTGCEPQHQAQNHLLEGIQIQAIKRMDTTEILIGRRTEKGPVNEDSATQR